MKWVCISEDQRREYINWVKIYKTSKPEIDIFEDGLQKGTISNIEDFIPKNLPFQFNDAICKNKYFIEESLKDQKIQVQIAALYYLIWYPDKSFISIVNNLHFKNQNDEEFKNNILKFLKEFKPEETNLPFGNNKKTDQNSSNDKIKELLHVDIMEIEIGVNLIPLVDKSQGGDLLERINTIRQQIVIDLGLIMPQIRIRDNIGLDKNEYLLKIKNNVVEKSTIFPDKLLSLNPKDINDEIKGESVIEPVFNLPAKWIIKEDRENTEKLGFNVVDATTVLATHIKEIVKRFGFEFLTRQATKDIINDLKKKYPVLVEDIIPEKISISTIHRILQNLLKNQISIRNIMDIFEILGDHADSKLTVDELTEVVKIDFDRFRMLNVKL